MESLGGMVIFQGHITERVEGPSWISVCLCKAGFGLYLETPWGFQIGQCGIYVCDYGHGMRQMEDETLERSFLLRNPMKEDPKK